MDLLPIEESACYRRLRDRRFEVSEPFTLLEGKGFLDAVTVNDDGTVDPESMSAVMDKLLDRYPYLHIPDDEEDLGPRPVGIRAAKKRKGQRRPRPSEPHAAVSRPSEAPVTGTVSVISVVPRRCRLKSPPLQGKEPRSINPPLVPKGTQIEVPDHPRTSAKTAPGPQSAFLQVSALFERTSRTRGTRHG
jgi:hypothetical protein